MDKPSEAARKLAKEVWRLAISSGPLFERQSLAETEAQRALNAAEGRGVARGRDHEAALCAERCVAAAAEAIERAVGAVKARLRERDARAAGTDTLGRMLEVAIRAAPKQAEQPDTVYRNILDTERALEVRAEQADHEFVPAAVPLCAECGKPRFMHNLPKSAHRRSEEKR